MACHTPSWQSNQQLDGSWRDGKYIYHDVSIAHFQFHEVFSWIQQPFFELLLLSNAINILIIG
jgi:hypothetical protein